MLSRPSNGFVAGLLVGVVIVTAMNLSGFRNQRDNAAHAALTSDAAARAFVSDWSRMRTATWAIDATFTRTTDDGATASMPLHQAQQDPSSIRETDMSADIVLNGRHYVCATGIDGKHSCRDAGVTSSFADRAKVDIASISNDVLGASRSYDVQQANAHCYTLYVRPAVIVPDGQWGNKSDVCFDAATGAPVHTRVYRSGGTDDVQTTSIRATPNPDEIRLPAPVTS
jgi:hypothetical protein